MSSLEHTDVDFLQKQAKTSKTVERWLKADHKLCWRNNFNFIRWPNHYPKREEFGWVLTAWMTTLIWKSVYTLWKRYAQRKYVLFYFWFICILTWSPSRKLKYSLFYRWHEICLLVMCIIRSEILYLRHLTYLYIYSPSSAMLWVFFAAKHTRPQQNMHPADIGTSNLT